jgi:NAD(P)H-flavin reductase
MPEERLAGVLRAREPVGGGLVRLEIEAPPGFAATYTVPGQYVAAGLDADAKETYLALSGEPRDARWEVLVRAGGEVVDALISLPLGGTVPLSRALGNGFPMAEATGRRLFVLATGSGFAAVRPVLRARLRDGLAGATELFLGVRSRAEVPLPGEIASLDRGGLAVTVCCSREQADEPGVTHGYVQDALRRRLGAGAGDAIVFAAGVAAMVGEMRALARELDLDEADIRTNY